jgi:flagellar assembly factor FliW
MRIETKFFGEVDVDEDKILTFEQGLLGFFDLKKFTVIYDSENEDPIISWLQSVDVKEVAFPIINPTLLFADYAPVIEDELLKALGELNEEKLLVFNILTIPEEVKNMTVNLKAPLIIHTSTKKGLQVVVENEAYDIRFPIYEHIKKIKEQKKVGE